MSAPNDPLTDSASIAALLESAQHGSHEALGKALEGCRQYLLVVAGDALGPALQAKVGPSDMVQDTLLKAQQEFRQFNGDTEAMWLAWLRTILLNTIANCKRQFATDMRQIAREVVVDGSESHETPVGGGPLAPGPSPSSVCIQGERDDALERALKQLPEHYQKVVQLRNREDLSFEAIGEKMGQSAEAVRKIWVRALRRLKEILEASHESESS